MKSPGTGVDRPLYHDGCCCLDRLGQIRPEDSQGRACCVSCPAGAKWIMVQNFLRHARAGMGVFADSPAFSCHRHNNCIVFQEKCGGRVADGALHALGRLCLDVKWRYLAYELILSGMQPAINMPDWRLRG